MAILITVSLRNSRIAVALDKPLQEAEVVLPGRFLRTPGPTGDRFKPTSALIGEFPAPFPRSLLSDPLTEPESVVIAILVRHEAVPCPFYELAEADVSSCPVRVAGVPCPPWQSFQEPRTILG